MRHPEMVAAGRHYGVQVATCVPFELRRLGHFVTKAAARAGVAAWIEEYNHDRRHSALGMLSPIAYERSRATLNEAPEQAA